MKELTRTELEKRIMEKGEEIDVSKPDAAWLDDEAFEEFLSAWQDLVRYYASHADDTVIGVEVLREYLDYTRLLRKVLLYQDIDKERREKVNEAIISLEHILGEIIKEVVTYLQFDQDG